MTLSVETEPEVTANMEGRDPHITPATGRNYYHSMHRFPDLAAKQQSPQKVESSLIDCRATMKVLSAGKVDQTTGGIQDKLHVFQDWLVDRTVPRAVIV